MAIIRPGTEAFTPFTLVVLVSAILAAAYQILTRKLAGQQGALASLFYPWVIGTVLCTPFAFYRWTPPDLPAHWVSVFLIALSALAGNICIVRAHEHGHASLIAPFLYLQLFWAAVMGWLVLGDFPDGWSIVGMSAIVFAGLMLIQRRSLLLLRR
jgi:drug/metabolite transporter (DMT)-like permease